VLAKSKALLGAVFKLKFILSFAAFFGFYWAAFGMKFGLGFAVLILIHEMGHFVAARRRGLKVDLPMFVPGLGAYVRWYSSVMGTSLEDRSAIALAGRISRFWIFLLIGLIPAVTTTALAFILLYGISYFFTEFGPNTTTFVYPAEIFPVEVRTTAHGLSAGAGKIGAFAGAYLFPDMLASSLGVRGAEIVAGIVAAAGLLVTVALLPEPKGRSLEDLSAQAMAPTQPKTLQRA